MKTFNFKTNSNDFNDTIDTNKINENVLRNFLNDSVTNKYPWLESTPKYASSDNYYGTCNGCPFAKSTNGHKNTYIYLDNNDISVDHDDYDFMIGNTPVRVFDDFVQVGYDIVPRKYFPLELYMDNNRRALKRTVIEIIIKIKTHKFLF